MTFLSVITSLITLLKYTPDAYAAIVAIKAVWEEQTGEHVSDEEWDSCVALLKEPSTYFEDLRTTSSSSSD